MEELGNNNKWDTKMGKTGKGGGNLFLIAELILKIISIFFRIWVRFIWASSKDHNGIVYESGQ